MFGKKKRISESFNVGNANMEIPDYEIKIEGQVPVTYATAINDRKETKKIINKKFEEKDKLTDEFIDENNNRLGDTNTMEIKESVESKIYKRAEQISSDIDNIAKDLARINYEDFISDKDLRQLTRAARILEDFSVAYAHVMEDENLSESDDNQSDDDVCPECKKNPCECVELKEARTRSANTKKEDKLFSSDDLWLKVYDDLSSEVENEGPNGEVNKEVKIPRGKRFIGPYAGPGDYDLTVYGKTMDDLKWAKKVADHYGVKIETKKDTNRRTNIYYPYTAILRDVR